jgi:hypothetical protein
LKDMMDMTPKTNDLMKHDIAFLHTSPVHVATFEKLMQELAPALRCVHVVRETLLSEAQHDGVASESLRTHVHESMLEAGATGASVVVCTCSTIGGIAETMNSNDKFIATRVDRAMADQAIKSGQTVLVVAALASTLEPTMALLKASAQRLGSDAQIESMVVADAWAHFLAGDYSNYINDIVAAIRQACPSTHIVVLAQASMAPAADALAKLGMVALSSPKLGVEYALALHAQA